MGQCDCEEQCEENLETYPPCTKEPPGHVRTMSNDCARDRQALRPSQGSRAFREWDDVSRSLAHDRPQHAATIQPRVTGAGRGARRRTASRRQA